MGIIMKVGTITHFRSNYGAILQAYALQVALQNLGHDPELIDFDITLESGTKWLDLKLRARQWVIKLFDFFRYRQFRMRNKRIATFKRDNLKISEERYNTFHELAQSSNSYDAFICGSDQVWHPQLTGDSQRASFLSFVKPEQARSISYAPSFGVSSISNLYMEKIRPWVNKIDNLSVREETGKGILWQTTGRKAVIVLDPTLLLEKKQWDRISAPADIGTEYILVYSTSQRGLFPELVRHVKRNTNLPVVVLSLTALNLIPLADRVIYDAGPSEFVGLFANASCVCTNSFHGTAFSIIFRKPFWTVPHNTTNSRMADLLQRIQLSDRQVNAPDRFPAAPLAIDFSKASTLLTREKRNSLAFLKVALQLNQTD